MLVVALIRNVLWYCLGMNVECAGCGGRFVSVGARGRTASYCSNACRQRAYRRRASAEKRFVESVGDRWVRGVGKRPVMVDGSPASSTNPATWASHAECVRGAGDGLGVMLGSVDGGAGIGCYDFDNCVESGDVQPWVADVIRKIPEPILFAELSVSGRGIHIFVKAPPAKGQRVTLECGNSYEKYTSARFIRCTFNMDIPELARLAMKSNCERRR